MTAEQMAAHPPLDPAETAIARLAQADRALAEAIEVADAVHLVSTAKALREWATAVHAGRDHERQAAVFVLRAVRNAGERIAAAQARGEVAGPGDFGRGRGIDVGSVDIYRPRDAHFNNPAASGRPATLAEIGVTRDESSEWKRLAAEYPTDEDLAEAAEALERPTLSGALRLAPLMSSESGEWYTPQAIIVAAMAALGGIDLDPCSNTGTPNVPASRHLTAEDDGLAHGWRGKVYMNPPYGREIGGWIDKLTTEFAYGNVTAAVALLPARTDTAWFRALPARWVCFVSGRLRFSGADPAPFPSVAAYLGPDAAAFADAFGSLGLLYQREDVA